MKGTRMKRLFVRSAIFAAILGISLSPALAADDEHDGSTPVSTLLAQGYEVRAAWSAPDYNSSINLLILQKGTSVYQCSNRRQLYANAYICHEIVDGKPVY
jgi:hypothetical protein